VTSVAPSPLVAPPQPRRRSRRALGRYLVALAVLAAAAWGGWRLYQGLGGGPTGGVPVAKVRRGDVTMTVFATGTLEGGDSELLSAPMIAGGDLSITELAKPGSFVRPGDVVVAFDTSVQEYNLKQAETALAIARQQVIEARAAAAATEEENRYALIKARYDVRRAQLQVRKDPILAAIDAQTNDLKLRAAEDHLRQLQSDLASQQATDRASIAIQEAALHKAQVEAATARRNIAAMTLRATHAGYVDIKTNTSTNFFYPGMQLPDYQVGDTTRPGMLIAEIPSTDHWQVLVNINELDRGHLNVGQPARIEFVGLPGQTFSGKVEFMGGVSGPPWARQVVTTVALDQSSPQLHPGMSASVQLITDRLRNVLWVPAQAVFTANGQSYVYLLDHGEFRRQPVTIVRQSESQVVVRGLAEGAKIALANPEQTAAPARTSRGPMQAVPGGGAGARGR